MPIYPTVGELRDRLHRAGWSLGETCFGQRWQVDWANGGCQAEAWELGMLAPGLLRCPEIR
jgi:hypothetical protein